MQRPLASGTGAAAAAVALTLVACAGNRSHANDPSQTTTTGVSVESGPATPGDPTGITSSTGGVKATSPSTASPMEGACPEGQPNRLSIDLAACIDSCRGYDDTVQLGSSCISQYASCTSNCEAIFPR